MKIVSDEVDGTGTGEAENVRSRRIG